MTSFFDLYRGATLPGSLIKQLGENESQAAFGQGVQRRRRLLQEGLQTGTISSSRLGQADASLLGVTPPQTAFLQKWKADKGGGGRSVFGFIGNLGEDVFNFGKEFVPGIVHTAYSAGHDIGDALQGNHQPSMLQKDVINPLVKNYKNTYAGGGGFGGFLKRFYEHPFGPVLDVATVASLGAGGAARLGGLAARTAPIDSAVGSAGARLARMTATTGRTPVELGNDVSFDRLWSRRPIRKAGQVIGDQIVDASPEALGLQRIRELRLSRRFTRDEYQQKQHLTAAALREHLPPLEQAFRELSPNESTALHLVLRGVNTAPRLEAFTNLMRNSLEGKNPEGHNIADFSQADRRHTEHLANLPDEVIELALHPNETMVNAAESWASQVSRGHELLDIPDELHDEAVARPANLLDEFSGEQHVPPEDRAIDPNYVPDRDVSGLKFYEPGPWGRALGRQPGFMRRGPEASVDTGAVTASNLLASKTPTFERNSSGATFAAGAFRTDSRVFLDHVAQRETHVIDKAYKQGLVRKFAAKGENADGEITELQFKTQDEVRDKLGANWVLVHPEFPITWFRAEKNVLKEALTIGKKLIDDGLMPGDAAFESSLDHLASADAQAFIRTNWGAMKKSGVAVPKDFFEYQRDLATVNDPFKSSFGRFYQKYINLWRTYTLAYMPRWALNTAIGTFLQAMVHGTVNPRDYLMGRHLDKSGVLPPGVKLGSEAIAEDIGPQRLGVIERVTGAKLPTRQIIEGVQAIEDHFRRSMFVKSLRKEDQARLNEMGESVKSWYGSHYTDEERIRRMLDDPSLVKSAVDDVNRFAYNYSHLGPFERRYVRQFVPFWGWYKFITKLAWRLPVEYPGRSRVMGLLGNVGLDQQDELGPIPDWLRGLITLNMAGGHLNYLSTVGINPFSQFANPLAPHGAVNGLLQLGQFSPVIQSMEQAYGLDPLTGDSVRISPESGVARDILGRLVDTKTGEQVSPASVDPLARGLMGLLRAFPQFRLGEKYALEGGGSVYPESVPFLHHRPMAPSAPGAATGLVAELGSATGLLPKVYDLGKYQQTTQKMLEYARTRNQSDLRRLSRKFNAPTP